MHSGAYIKYLYDIMRHLIGVIKYDATGRELSAFYYRYNSNGELEWTKGPGHEKDYTLFDYDAAGNQVFKARWRFKIDDPRYIDQKIVPIPGYQSFISQAIELKHYDELARLTHIFDPEGHVTEYSYDALGHVIKYSVSEKLGENTLTAENYEYEPGGLISKIIHADKSETSRFYTSNGLLTREEYPNGSHHVWFYDNNGRITDEITENGANWHISYDDAAHTITKREINTGIFEIYRINAHGNLIEKNDIGGGNTHYIYDNLGRLIKEEQNGQITRYNYRYDKLGNTIVEKTLPDNTRIQKIHDGSNRLLEVSWHEATEEKPTKRIHYEYQADGRTCEFLGDNEAKFCYFTDPDGRHLIDWEWYANPQDPNNDLLAGKSYGYDRNGNLVDRNIPTLLSDSYLYDGLGRITKMAIHWRSPIEFEYDLNNNLIKGSTPAGITWNNKYNSTTVHEEWSSWGDQIIRGSTHQQQNANTHTITDRNGYKFVHHFDIFGRTTKIDITGPQDYHSAISYSHDLAGNLILISQKNPHDETIIHRTYDLHGKILRETVSLNGVKISDWEQIWRANRRESLVSLLNSQPEAAWNFKTNANGALTSLEFNNFKRQFRWDYQYNTAGQLKKRVSPWQTITAEYDTGGHLIKRQIGSILSEELVRNLDGKIDIYRYNREGTLRAMSYTFNLHGRIVTGDYLGETGAINQADYNFDDGTTNSLGILTGVETRGIYNFQHQTESAKLGNYTRPEQETFQGLSRNRLLVSESAETKPEQVSLHSTYDAMGRVTERTFKEWNQKQILQWDPQGRLVKVILKTGQGEVLSEWRANYDGLGRRIQTSFIPYKANRPETEKTEIRTSLYDPEVEFLELGVRTKIGNQEPITIWKIYGASNNGIYGEHNGSHDGLEAVTAQDGTAAYGVISNLLGNIAITQDTKQQVCWQKDLYLAYGPVEIPRNQWMINPATGDDLAKIELAASLWQARKMDPTGFVNFGARYYDPLIGRFLSCDPLGHEASLDLYSYADGDPINYIDPDGRFASEVYATTMETLTTLGEILTSEEVVRAAMGAGTYLICESTAAGGAVLGGGNLGDVAVGAACSHPICLGLARQAYSNLYFSGKVKEKAQKSSAGGEKAERVHGHHPYPKFMGGKNKQDLVTMKESLHIDLHKNLIKFLKDKYPNMVPKRGYKGIDIQRAVEEELRVQAIKEFYTGPGSKYAEAAKAFFEQIPK